MRCRAERTPGSGRRAWYPRRHYTMAQNYRTAGTRLLVCLGAALSIAGCATADLGDGTQMCAAGRKCPEGQRCLSDNRCYYCGADLAGCSYCAADSECSGVTPRCDTTVGRCVACLYTNDNCAAGYFCQQQNGVYSCLRG